MKQFDLSNIELSRNDVKRGLVLPEGPSKELAEFIGVLAGDGYVSFNTGRYVISVAGHSILDSHYLKNYVKPLIKRLFNLNVKLVYRKDYNLAEVVFQSKGVLSFLNSIGYHKHKSRNIRVPSFIQRSLNFKLSFVRGLADTDFSLMLYRNRKDYPHYPIIGLTTVSKQLLSFVKKCLEDNGFLVYTREDLRYDKRTNNNGREFRLRLSGRQNLQLWMELIGFNNSRHWKKYAEYVASGKITKKVGRPQLSIKGLQKKKKMGTRGFELSVNPQ